MEAKSRRERYGQLESALNQALQDNEVAAERRHKEMGSLQQMVATSDGMAFMLGGMALLAVAISLLYLPQILEGDTMTVALLGILLAGGVARAAWSSSAAARSRPRAARASARRASPARHPAARR